VSRELVDASGQPPLRFRWVCHCAEPPVLLAIYDETGRIEVKVRQRLYIAHKRLEAICPRCGTRHVLHLHPPDPAAPGHGA
jgi:hypothetical protein